ncbi:hypothetical protein V493_01297 [Pseudogymnoascus sp. VKM F-4281 (FW-2241)]|nr:hypothetical protein V493_01297 [Pseudogymnoascus sp. VKM F-4281 (FW-2241)]
MISFNPLSVKALVLLTTAVGVIANPVLKGRASSCDVVRCASGTVCKVIDNVAKCVGGEKCGTAVCGAGLVCCNPLCNICTKPGEFCVQGCPATDAVVKEKTGPVCGPNTCASGEKAVLALSVVQTLAHSARYAATRAAGSALLQAANAPCSYVLRSPRSAQRAARMSASPARYAATRAAGSALLRVAIAPSNSVRRRLILAQRAGLMSANLARYAATAAAESVLLRAANAPSNSVPRRPSPAQRVAQMSAHPARYAATAAVVSALLRAVNAPSNSAGKPLKRGRDELKREDEMMRHEGRKANAERGFSHRFPWYTDSTVASDIITAEFCWAGRQG